MRKNFLELYSDLHKGVDNFSSLGCYDEIVSCYCASFIIIVRVFLVKSCMYSLETISTLWHMVQLHENSLH